ncbi:MAG: hypothetical protein WAM95_15265 [Bacillus sp. (in: firmicutes)]
MKKYILFLTSFAVFYGMFQIISGLILTAFYTPNFALMNTGLSHEVTFGHVGNFPFMSLLLIAMLAYFFTQKLTATILKRAFIKK